MTIFVGVDEADPRMGLFPGGFAPRRQHPPSAILCGLDEIWPDYQEAFYWFEWDTPGYIVIGEQREWLLPDVPTWGAFADLVLCAPGERGADGTRGFGNNDGRGGRGRHVVSSSGTLRERPAARMYGLNRQGVLPVVPRSDFLIETYVPPGDVIEPSGSTGATVPPHTAFGRSFPGGAGGPLNTPGSKYGGGGGGGIGAPPVGGDRQNGYNGGSGYTAVRIRSGPVPDGHVWPEDPDWANPQ